MRWRWSPKRVTLIRLRALSHSTVVSTREKTSARVYIPVAGASVACGPCWGLTYASRTLYNYKDSLAGRGPLARLLDQTHRFRALLATHHRREYRRMGNHARRTKRDGTMMERTVAPGSSRYRP
jgi:hypothetical protein